MTSPWKQSFRSSTYINGVKDAFRKRELEKRMRMFYSNTFRYPSEETIATWDEMLKEGKSIC